jgi:hypothetical protein
VVLGSYPTREELYAAYVLALEGSSGAPVPENVGECTPKVAEGEVSWNLQGRHRRDLTVEQEAHAGIDPVSGAAGRVYCATTSSLATLVWTQDPGLLVVAVGERAPDLIHWWQRVHLDLACTARGGEASATGCRGLVL